MYTSTLVPAQHQQNWFWPMRDQQYNLHEPRRPISLKEIFHTFFHQPTDRPSNHPTKATHRSSLPELKNICTQSKGCRFSSFNHRAWPKKCFTKNTWTILWLNSIGSWTFSYLPPIIMGVDARNLKFACWQVEISLEQSLWIYMYSCLQTWKKRDLWILEHF